jgi:hypothetical protein
MEMLALRRPRIARDGAATGGKRHPGRRDEGDPEQTGQRNITLMTLHGFLLIGHRASTSPTRRSGERGAE